jgi:hypothetical protein
VTARLAHGGLEPEFTNVDIWQSRLPALRTKMLAPLPNPIRSLAEFLARHLVLVRRFWTAIGDEELSREGGVPEEAGTNLDSSNSCLETWRI